MMPLAWYSQGHNLFYFRMAITLREKADYKYNK